ncbi:6111_t:CDS:2, partial [Entrophospora sp. SA101]
MHINIQGTVNWYKVIKVPNYIVEKQITWLAINIFANASSILVLLH